MTTISRDVQTQKTTLISTQKHPVHHTIRTTHPHPPFPHISLTHPPTKHTPQTHPQLTSSRQLSLPSTNQTHPPSRPPVANDPPTSPRNPQLAPDRSAVASASEARCPRRLRFVHFPKVPVVIPVMLGWRGAPGMVFNPNFEDTLGCGFGGVGIRVVGRSGFGDDGSTSGVPLLDGSPARAEVHAQSGMCLRSSERCKLIHRRSLVLQKGNGKKKSSRSYPDSNRGCGKCFDGRWRNVIDLSKSRVLTATLYNRCQQRRFQPINRIFDYNCTFSILAPREYVCSTVVHADSEHPSNESLDLRFPTLDTHERSRVPRCLVINRVVGDNVERPSWCC